MRDVLSICSIAILLVAAAGAVAAPTAWRTYTDPRLAFSISYPSGWKFNSNYVSVSLGPDHEIKGVAFVIPRSLARGTNLSANDTEISVESIPGANCKPSQFVNPAESVHTLTADGRVYRTATSGDAGAGNRYDTMLFVVEGTSPCIAVRYFIHYTVFENYDPGTIKQFDRDKLITLFDNIRASLKLSP